jgi:hypothetical protein
MPVVASSPTNAALAKAIATAINAYTGDALDFTAVASGDTVTIVAPEGRGGIFNGLPVTFATSGDRTLNGFPASQTAATLSGGAGGNVVVSSTIFGTQFAGTNVAVLFQEIAISGSARGQVRGYSGSIRATVPIRGALFEAIYGTSVAKINVLGALSTPEYSIAVPKATIHAHIIDTPNAQHVAKAVAYAVIGPDEDVDYESYEAVLFF